jgi:hypothetical protein
MAAYYSEFTQFMQTYLKEHPDILKDQWRGHKLLWDKDPIDLQERKRAKESFCPQKPYPYQTDLF